MSMSSRLRGAVLCAAAAVLVPLMPARPAQADGLIAKGDYFPMGVWLQQPSNAERYKAVGIHVFVGLDRGATEEGLAQFEKAGAFVACAQNRVALEPKWSKVVVGWTQNDEPDNAQEKKGGGGYGPPVKPEVIVQKYNKMKAADPLHRPVMLNLGMGVAWDGWYGRGVGTNHPQDYPQYAKGGDILSFDIYPMCANPEDGGGKDAAYAGKMQFVGNGVKRLVGWVDNKKPVWTCIETSHIGNPNAMVTPAQVRDEVWMAIINGARGILYFAHEFKPKFIEAGLLAHKDIAQAVKGVNAEVQSLARVINDGKPIEGAKVDSPDITIMTRDLGGEQYVFAVGMQPGPITAHFETPGLTGKKALEVFGESRSVDSADGKWSDTFTGYQVHIYHLNGAAK